MFRSSPKRVLLVRLLGSLGPPPPPPRRHFSKCWSYDGQYRAGVGRRGAGSRWPDGRGGQGRAGAAGTAAASD